MIQKKVCMLGGFAVGKTSLVSRFVSSMFSDKYLTTVGVKIDKKAVSVRGREVEIILWDIYGEDEYQKIRTSYLRGAAGYLLVADGTRQATLDTAREIQSSAEQAVGNIPFILVLNKCDLVDAWALDEEALAQLAAQDWKIVRTSAKTGVGVDDTFLQLAGAMTGKTA